MVARMAVHLVAQKGFPEVEMKAALRAWIAVGHLVELMELY